MIVRVSGLPGQIAVFPAEMFAGAFTTQDDDDEKWRVIVSVTHASSPIFGPWESADDAAACLETVLMSVGAVAEPGEPEAALDTVTLALPEPVLTVDEAQQALGMAAIEVGLQGVLTGVHVVVDMTGAEATTVMAVSEIVTKLCKRGAKSIEFVTDNNGVAARIEVTLIVNKIATLLPVTLVDNSVEPEPEPDPEPDDTKPVLAYSEDGTRVELPPDTLLYGIVCQHEQRPQYCRWCRDESMGVMLKTRFGKVFVPLTNPGDPAPSASWVSEAYVQQLLAEVFEKGKA